MVVAEAARARAGPTTVDQVRLHLIASRRFDRSIAGVEGFFHSHADAVSAAALDMARRFSAGGRLLAFAEGAAVSDAQHVSVEFVHPVIVGKRALPAVALPNDAGTMTAREPAAFASMLSTLGRPGDIAFGIGAGGSAALAAGLARATAMGMLTISIEPGDTGNAAPGGADHHFLLLAGDPLVAQEVAETLYHVLWELVHLFLEHGANDATRTTP